MRVAAASSLLGYNWDTVYLDRASAVVIKQTTVDGKSCLFYDVISVYIGCCIRSD
jgi:hypothetical protein